MSASGFDVIVCGSLHLDIMLNAPHLPRPDETVAGTRWRQQCGGKGGNQAVMAARAGARTAMIGRVGADDFGTRLRQNLTASGVHCGSVIIDSESGSGISAAIVQDDGEYGAVIVSGSNLRIEPASLDSQWRVLGGARVLVLQNEVPELVNIAAAKAARDSGALVILNAAPARAMSRDLLDRVDVLVVNRVEAAMLAETEIAQLSDAFEALPRLRAPGRAAIVTLGGDGLVFQPPEGEPQWVGPKVVKVVSTHGAGDCFVGTFAARVAAGKSLLEATEFANGAAADFVGRQASH